MDTDFVTLLDDDGQVIGFEALTDEASDTDQTVWVEEPPMTDDDWDRLEAQINLEVL